ncbi:MAG: hypothetical protein ACW976_06585 [Candidatus Ranarchaeia archaeon]|jgi:4-amino-4-deoxy-L-arabinose transferase-like glycosyltransferase
MATNNTENPEPTETSKKKKKKQKASLNVKSETITLYLRSLILVGFMMLPMLAIYDHFLETLLHPYGSWAIDIPNILLGAIGYENWVGRLALIGVLATVGVLVNIWYFALSKEQTDTSS